ncbi:unannotated protein [freshwater metagenome]|uniref:Unannotated protein n=1 Tax=freshwater metagenome TaxID=449393 RepID=A0A6J7J1V1_9ZZZZ
MVGGGEGEPTNLVRALRQVCCSLSAVDVVFGIHGGADWDEHDCPGTTILRFGWFGQPPRTPGSDVIVRLPYSQIPQFLAGRDIVVLAKVAPERNGLHSLSMTAEYLPAAIDGARTTLVEVDETAPWVTTTCAVAADVVEVLARTSSPLGDVTAPALGDASNPMAAIVGRTVPDGAIVQLGLGRVVDEALAGLQSRRGLRVRSGSLSTVAAQLWACGVLDTGHPAIATALFGGREVREWASQGNVLLERVEKTHGQSLVGLVGLHSINAAVQVDLAGNINTEAAGGRYVGAMGGAPDFAAAAVKSPGGQSVFVLPSTAQAHRVSRIVPRPVELTTVPASDVSIVITEWGSAQVQGLGVRDRAHALAAIAHPQFRAELLAHADRIADRNDGRP